MCRRPLSGAGGGGCRHSRAHLAARPWSCWPGGVPVPRMASSALRRALATSSLMHALDHLVRDPQMFRSASIARGGGGGSGAPLAMERASARRPAAHAAASAGASTGQDGAGYTVRRERCRIGSSCANAASESACARRWSAGSSDDVGCAAAAAPAGCGIALCTATTWASVGRSANCYIVILL